MSVRIEDISIIIPIGLSIGFGVISYFVFPLVPEGYQVVGDVRRSNPIMTADLATLKYFTLISSLVVGGFDFYFAWSGLGNSILFLSAALSWVINRHFR